MTSNSPDLSGRQVLVPGGTGAVGEGVVRRYLAAGADVVVPTRSEAKSQQFRSLLGDAADDRLHLVVHDYTTFAGAEDLVAHMIDNRGAVDDVVAPIGGWWAGKQLTQIDDADWQSAFVGLATAHLAVARAALPRMTATGAYTVIVGESASWPVPGSGLVSMEQAAILMMQRVLAAEADGSKRVFAFVLGQVNSRIIENADSGWVTADQVGAMAVAVSASSEPGREIRLTSKDEAQAELTK